MQQISTTNYKMKQKEVKGQATFREPLENQCFLFQPMLEMECKTPRSIRCDATQYLTKRPPVTMIIRNNMNSMLHPPKSNLFETFAKESLKQDISIFVIRSCTSFAVTCGIVSKISNK